MSAPVADPARAVPMPPTPAHADPVLALSAEHVETDLPHEALTCLAVMRDTVRVLSAGGEGV